ncbi:putative nudix hydrolase YeaB [Candidatus Burkholderia verschuerenii]|uniref:Putative nudix hydrolase YeaB n=1 Tax=Candidatus Burkholderia verschuerenii TaxID=242163 RepID=A0A0L0M704_9BURK|nr:putative nudix hydrolase YeaB [Candidatus Burkholderia verschuerenii]
MPVLSTGEDLPPVSPERLTPDGLRARFAMNLDWTQEAREQRIKAIGGDPRVASVLVPLVLREGGLTVLLTQRADHLSDHAGQISFPGGRREPEDIDAAATALREAQEEVGLSAEHCEIIGAMPEYLTGTGFKVTPVVALVFPPFTLQADTREVADIFEVPLAWLMNPANHEVRIFRWEGGERRFFAMPYTPAENKAPYSSGAQRPACCAISIAFSPLDRKDAGCMHRDDGPRDYLARKGRRALCYRYAKLELTRMFRRFA